MLRTIDPQQTDDKLLHRLWYSRQNGWVCCFREPSVKQFEHLVVVDERVTKLLCQVLTPGNQEIGRQGEVPKVTPARLEFIVFQYSSGSAQTSVFA